MKKSAIIFGFVILIITGIVFLLSGIADKSSTEPLKMLFIGNSYTFNNDLPSHVREMRLNTASNLSVEIKTLAPGGAKLDNHRNSSLTLDTIRNGNWDIVVIQGNSLEPLKSPDAFADAALDLIRIINESGAEAYLFETWSRAPGHSIYSEAWSGNNPETMQMLLSKKYSEVAQKTEASVIPIGTIWQQVLKDKTQLELYSSDGSHPTVSGTYLIACIMFKYIFNEDPTELSYVPALLNKSDAELLRNYVAAFYGP